jgi:hypothetical protein
MIANQQYVQFSVRRGIKPLGNKSSLLVLVLLICSIVILAVGCLLRSFPDAVVTLQISTIAMVPQNPSIIVVSYAQGEPYETTMQHLNESVVTVGNADKFIGWKKQDLMSQYADLNATWDFFSRRPACMAMKSTTVLDAMETHDDGDWIVWIDSSKYFIEPLTEDLRKVVEVIEKSGHDAFPGVPLCLWANVDFYGLVDFEMFRRMDLNVPDYWFAPHYQNNMFIFKNTPRNRAFVAEWKMYNLMLDVSCLSHTQDQAIFSLLVKKYDLPAMNLCSGRPDDPHTSELKNVNWVFRTLVNTLEVHLQRPLDVTKFFIESGWFPQPQHVVSQEFCFKPYYYANSE